MVRIGTMYTKEYMDEKENTKRQILHIEYRDGTKEVHDDILGYRVGGGVMAIDFKNHSLAIIPLDTIQGVLIFNKE